MDQVRHYEQNILTHGVPKGIGIGSNIGSRSSSVSGLESTAEVSPANMSTSVPLKPFDVADLSLFNKVCGYSYGCVGIVWL